MSQFIQELTHATIITAADEQKLGPGVAIYYNPRETYGPDYVTIGMSRIAGGLVDTVEAGRIYEPGVGTGAFLVGAAINSRRAAASGLHVAGDDISSYAIRTAAYNLKEAKWRKNLRLTSELYEGSWEMTLSDSRLTPGYSIIHYNPPFKSPDDPRGYEGVIAPGTALHAEPNERGYPSAYENYLPALYKLLLDDGVAMIRLPSGQREVNFDQTGFDEYIDGIQMQAFEVHGLRTAKVWVDVPEKTPVPWDHPEGKHLPYRSAAALIVSRTLPDFFASRMRSFGEDETILYEDIQIRVRMVGSQAVSALVDMQK